MSEMPRKRDDIFERLKNATHVYAALHGPCGLWYAVHTDLGDKDTRKFVAEYMVTHGNKVERWTREEYRAKDRCRCFDQAAQRAESEASAQLSAL